MVKPTVTERNAGDIIVLANPKPGSAQNTYADRWRAALEESGASVLSLTPLNVLRNRRASVHIHWPEHLIHHDKPLLRLAKVTETLLTLALLRLSPRKLIWTAHNSKPHTIPLVGLQDLVFRAVRRQATDVVITTADHQALLTSLYPELENTRFHVIPLGSLAPALTTVASGEDAVAEYEQPKMTIPPSEGTLFVQFGVISEYKDQLGTMETLRPLLTAGQVNLVLAGTRGAEEYVEKVLIMADSLPGVEVRAERLTDHELGLLIDRADVSLALQSDSLNSGVIPASVPLGTPVVSAATSQALALSESVGAEWICCLGPDPSEDDWRQVLEWVKQPRGPVPVEDFDWMLNAQRHVEVYRS